VVAEGTTEPTLIGVYITFFLFAAVRQMAAKRKISRIKQINTG
jgi:hypothetical protein